LINGIKAQFPQGLFRPPATADEILWAERQLKLHLPEPLRKMYLAFDGFRDATSGSAYLLPLTVDEGAGSLVATNIFFRDNYSAIYPHLNLKRFIFFGMSGGDKYFGINLDNPSEIIAYDLEVGTKYEVIGSDILQVYATDQKQYIH
jgi:hypothetical protein